MRYRVKGGYRLTSDQVDIIIGRLQPSLANTFVTTDEAPISLGDIVELFRYENFFTPAADGPLFKLALNETVKKVVAIDLLAREGRKQQLQNTEGVRNDLRLWSDNWRAGAQIIAIRNGVFVSHEDILRYLLRNKEIFGKKYEVNIREILCDSLDDVPAVMSEFRSGNPSSEFARQFHLRPEWAKTGGTSGYFPVLRHPDIGFRALLADTGRVIGPIHTAEGYSVYRVLGKRVVKGAEPDIDAFTKNIRTRLSEQKEKESIDRTIADLARQGNLKINYDALKNLKVTTIPMFTRRYLGYGGVMSAAPILLQQWEWIKEYQRPIKTIP
jgi:hypothetical protein